MNFKNIWLPVLCASLIAIVATGCKPKPFAANENPSLQAKNSSAYFQTSFQEESQFIVEAVVSDLTEQMYYAAYHRLPDPKSFQVTATEKAGSPQDAPVYELQICVDPKQGVLKSEINVNGPIWSPTVYRDVAAELAGQFGLAATNGNRSQDSSFLAKLTDESPQTIEEQNQELSAALEDDFKNPELHEKAAALLGAFLLRDHSGYFFEIRSPLSRMTAHLAMAQFLNGTNSFGINGQMAEAMLLTLINDEAPALETLNNIGTNDAAIAPIVRALWTRNTGDYRLLGGMNNLTPIESVEWFCAMSGCLGTELAWPKLNDIQERTIDFTRIANQNGYSVEIGHQLVDVSIPLELQEIENVYEHSNHKPLTRAGIVQALNEMPERCFTRGFDGGVHVCVIGWGQWADFLQRHLCLAIQSDFDCLQNKWGVYDDAKEFASKCDQEFGGLHFYPFVERFDCTTVNSYHKSVDDGFKVTVDIPQLTPASCWNWLCYSVDFAPLYSPNPNPHINEWHKHNPPPGTVYDIYPRLNHPSLINRRDVDAYFEQLHKWAPYDCSIIDFILKNKYNNHPTYDQAMGLYKNLLPYSLDAIEAVANAVQDQPEQYEKLMVQAAQLNGSRYFTLGEYVLNRREDDKAAQYYDEGAASDQDSVRIASYAPWRVQYYLGKGDTNKAAEIADFAGEVYSDSGLEAEGLFFEMTGDNDKAFNWYQKVEDRYDDSGPLVGFCLRYKASTGDTRFDAELQKRMPKLFPKGIENASLADFHGPPSDGVLIQEQNDLLHFYGLSEGDIIVAVDGMRTHTFAQYSCLRDMRATSEMDLIVWQGSAYHEVKASPPNHRFGADFGDYRPQ